MEKGGDATLFHLGASYNFGGIAVSASRQLLSHCLLPNSSKRDGQSQIIAPGKELKTHLEKGL